jgi:hypothetical protein
LTGKEIQKRERKDMIGRVVELARQGHNDSQIGRWLDIHRTTVRRYREQGEKRAIGTEARIRVVQEALAKHFADLCQTCERLRSEIRSGEPERTIIEDLQTSRLLTRMSSGRRGDEVKVILRVCDGKAEIVHLSIEEELIYASLKQHTRNLSFWKLFQEWKDKSGEYMSNLSDFYCLLKQQATEETGLEIADSYDSHGLTSHFSHTIHKDACDHAFFGYKGFEGVDYAVNSLRLDWHELRFDGLTIALACDKEQLERCQEVHCRMMDCFRHPHNRPQELQKGVHIWHQLKELESEIGLALQKLILKRSFPGRCELCPD